MSLGEKLCKGPTKIIQEFYDGLTLRVSDSGVMKLQALKRAFGYK